MPCSFDEEKGEEECSSGCSTLDADDQFPVPPRFYCNRSSNRREHQRQRRCRIGATNRFGGSKVHRSEALLAALCVSVISLVWIITRDGSVPFPLLSFLVPRAFTAGEMDSMTDVSGAKWAPDGAVQGSMAAAWSSLRGDDATTLLHDPRPPSGWIKEAENFEIPFEDVNGEPRAIDRAVRTFSRITSNAADATDFVTVPSVRAKKPHGAGDSSGGDDRSIRNANEPPRRPVVRGAPAQIIGMREVGRQEERLSSGTPVDVHKAVIADTALAYAREKKGERSRKIIEGRPRSKLVEENVENPHLDDMERKGGGRGAWKKEPPGTNTGGSIGGQEGGVPRKAGLSGGRDQEHASKGPDDDHKTSPHTLSSIQRMISNAVDSLAPIEGKSGGKASPSGVEENAVVSVTPIASPPLPSLQRAEGKKLASTRTAGDDLKKKITVGDVIHLSHRVGTVGDLGSKGRRSEIPGEGKKLETKINILGEEKKQEVEETMNSRRKDATAATATDAAAPAREEKKKKGNKAKHDKEALPAERGGVNDRDDSEKRDMSIQDSKPQQQGQTQRKQQQQLQLQRTEGLTEPSPALPSEPVDAAIGTAGLKKEAVRARTEVAALRIKPVEQAAHLAAAVVGDEGHEEGRAHIMTDIYAAGSGGGAGTRSTGEGEGVRREQMANEGRGPVEAGNDHQTITGAQRPQRGEFVVDSRKRLRVRPPSRHASRWAQALGAGDNDEENENHPPLPPPPPTRDQRKKTGTDDEERASKEAGKPCRLSGNVDRWEPPEAADLRSTYRWKDEQKASMEKIRRFSKGGNELRDLIHSEVVRLDILRHDLFCP